ncbi:MAG TPA: TIGR01620 family protein [Rhizobiales bacterium]|nr:TIGR01620 family protein [Hyphomicrobiales bacterium]
MTGNRRAPAAFRLDDSKEKPAVKPKPEKSARKPRATTPPKIHFEPDPAPPPSDLLQAGDGARTIHKTIKWGGLLLSALASLFTLWLSMTAIGFIENLFARSPLLGTIGFGLLVIAVIAILALFFREIFGLMRLGKLTSLHDDANRARTANDAAAARRTIKGLKKIYDGRPDTAWGLSALKEHEKNIVDPEDLITLAERDLVEPLDEEAGRIIASASRRVTVMTAIAPAAILDVIIVAALNARMLRDLATLYGGRPGTFGTMKLARMAITHLAITGSLALTDSVVQHVIGKGLAGRLSSRFGEGAVNGILTTRIGLAALDVTRPIPFSDKTRPGLAGMLKNLMSFTGGSDKDVKAP